jgi:hypothetical protein
MASQKEGAMRREREGHSRRLTATDLMKRPVAECRRVLERAATTLETAYRNDANLAGFEAFGEEDFLDEPCKR